MPGPHPAVAACRSAVRRALRAYGELPEHALVLVACSGGADSLALAAAAAFEAPRAGLRAGAIVVDHRLQPGSEQVAARAAAQCLDLGLDPVDIRAVDVGTGAGPEAEARMQRYAALADAAAAHGARCVLAGHTRDDQAESVLLALARGSGTRSLAGMSPCTTLPTARIDPADRASGSSKRALDEQCALLRPFLDDLTRAQTRAACTALGITWWDDPHNEDRRYLRVRARATLQDLEKEIGPGVIAGLARSAQIARGDADLLDEMALAAADRLREPPWAADELAALPQAVRARVWRLLMARQGAAAADVGRVHVQALDALLTAWHGQGPVDVPGGLRARRVASRLVVERGPVQ
ncbi:tRNA lysidine(34) synthetase TilS [Leekyejoonella antrihumi]|uniref:tRNA(Ile)-lysidine synthase n=1 Tax=Leekyejoonella antrihumi TaxID=1660198 RepID=A0A563DTS8_9MICO|nr:tRNA lysidine(34) synthetase TilS [Leekyejoonella antrihumi]TWP33667.1 tRNA lysidine(34) synthetase TilS [Leekyejoonella antrihumi]